MPPNKTAGARRTYATVPLDQYLYRSTTYTVKFLAHPSCHYIEGNDNEWCRI